MVNVAVIKVASSFAIGVVLLAGCAKTSESVDHTLPVATITVDKVTSEASGERPALIFSTVIDSHHFDIPLAKADYEKRVQNYAGRYFYDLQSKCLDASCANLAVVLTVWVAGGTREEVSVFQREYFKVNLSSGEMSAHVKSGGNGFEDARLDEYAAGTLK